jgi:protein-S-isoprenylcysteine O-methyltransferase Ste14
LLSPSLHSALIVGIFVCAVFAVVALLYTSAPYGRHARAGWGPTLPGRVAWLIMESPAVLGFAWVFAQGTHRADLVPLALLGLWMLHYVHRGLIFPFRLRSTRPMAAVVALMAVGYQAVNAVVNAAWISDLGAYPDAWALDPRFLGGAALFVTGWALNLHADTVLMNLRAPGETGYRIPQGGLFRWVTAGNYLGELVMWAGWALATWSWAGLSFFVFTAANLAPRAAQNHRWYQERFGAEYPPERRRLIPFVW